MGAMGGRTIKRLMRAPSGAAQFQVVFGFTQIRLSTKLMKRLSDSLNSLIGTFVGSLIVFLVQSSRMHPEEGLFPGLILVPLLGAIIGTIVGRIHHRSA
jgi:hypothetical protein